MYIHIAVCCVEVRLMNLGANRVGRCLHNLDWDIELQLDIAAYRIAIQWAACSRALTARQEDSYQRGTIVSIRSAGG